MPRRHSNLDYEAARASLALAGLRIISQTTVTAAFGNSTSYTVLSKDTRRVVCLHLASGNADIRVNYNSAALATHMPMLPGRYFVVDAGIVDGVADTVNFYNDTGSNITVYVMEVA